MQCKLVSVSMVLVFYRLAAGETASAASPAPYLTPDCLITNLGTGDPMQCNIIWRLPETTVMFSFLGHSQEAL